MQRRGTDALAQWKALDLYRVWANYGRRHQAAYEENDEQRWRSWFAWAITKPRETVIMPRGTDGQSLGQPVPIVESEEPEG